MALYSWFSESRIPCDKKGQLTSKVTAQLTKNADQTYVEKNHSMWPRAQVTQQIVISTALNKHSDAKNKKSSAKRENKLALYRLLASKNSHQST